MRALALCLCFSLIICGCSTDAVKLVTPTPVTIALTLGEWIIRDNKRVFVVEVESTASTIEDARKEAFKLAVAKAVGSLVVSEREIRNSELIRDDILMYSSGYVEDYEFKSETQVGSLYRVVALVWVSESKIADRLQISKKAAGQVDGPKLARKLETYVAQKVASDKLITNIISDFPKNSFVIEVGKTSSRLVERSLQVIVPFSIRWEQSYITALEEALVRTREGNDPLDWRYARLPSVIAVRKKGDWFKTFAAYSDGEKEALFHKYLINTRPHLLVESKNNLGNLINTMCYEIPYLTGYFLGDSLGFGYYPKDRSGKIDGQFFAANTNDASFTIFGDFEYSDKLVFSLNLTDNSIKSFDKVSVSIVRLKQCVNVFDPNIN
jgi:hypothetical protein